MPSRKQISAHKHYPQVGNNVTWPESSKCQRYTAGAALKPCLFSVACVKIGGGAAKLSSSKAPRTGSRTLRKLPAENEQQGQMEPPDCHYRFRWPRTLDHSDQKREPRNIIGAINQTTEQSCRCNTRTSTTHAEWLATCPQ